MYIPAAFSEPDIPTMHAFMEAHPLAALVTSAQPGGLIATHLPFVLDRSAGSMGTLFGHLARANPHSRLAASEPAEALVIYTGPDAYISPEWYATKQDTGRVVPTWNYVAVHAYGALHFRDDPGFLRAHLETLTRTHEGDRAHPWHVSDAPADYIAQQMKAIVAVELRIDRLEGKCKMSQNRSAADVDGVIHGLASSEAPKDQAVAAIVRQRSSASPRTSRS